jgi:SH3-like domain-containing protein
MRRRFAAAPLAALALIAFGASASAAPAPAVGPDSHRPVPRFASLKAPGANGRHGPGLDYNIDWIYERAGLPLQVVAESGPWRRVRDPDGAEVWMHARNLEERRTVYVRGETEVALHSDPRGAAHTVAWLAPGVVGAITACQGDWRRVAVGGHVGWVKAAALWAGDDCAGL